MVGDWLSRSKMVRRTASTDPTLAALALTESRNHRRFARRRYACLTPWIRRGREL
jgi:hypothetical protein